MIHWKLRLRRETIFSKSNVFILKNIHAPKHFFFITSFWLLMITFLVKYKSEL